MGSRTNMNKRAVVQDMLYLVIAAFAVGIFLLAWMNFWPEIQSGMQGAIGGIDPAVDATLRSGDIFIQMSDFAYIGTAIGMFAVIALFAVLVLANPIFYVIYWIVWLISVAISIILSNGYEVARTSAALSTGAAFIPMTNLFIANLPIIVTLYGVLIGVIAYAKFYRGGGGSAQR